MTTQEFKEYNIVISNGEISNNMVVISSSLEDAGLQALVGLPGFEVISAIDPSEI